MLEFLKTPAGAYNLTFILAIMGWLLSGVGIFAGFHLTKVRAIDSQEKTKVAIEERNRFQSQLEATSKELEETKAKTLTHDDILSYRTVTSDQRRAFIDATKDLPKGRLFVIAVMGDTESYKYAEAINEMLFAAGYEPTKQVSTVGSFGGPTTGITAGIESEDNKPTFAEPLILALQGAGFPVQPIIVSGAASRGPEYVHITVGSKPR